MYILQTLNMNFMLNIPVCKACLDQQKVFQSWTLKKKLLTKLNMLQNFNYGIGSIKMHINRIMRNFKVMYRYKCTLCKFECFVVL